MVWRFVEQRQFRHCGIDIFRFIDVLIIFECADCRLFNVVHDNIKKYDHNMVIFYSSHINNIICYDLVINVINLVIYVINLVIFVINALLNQLQIYSKFSQVANNIFVSNYVKGACLLYLLSISNEVNKCFSF